MEASKVVWHGAFVLTMILSKLKVFFFKKLIRDFHWEGCFLQKLNNKEQWQSAKNGTKLIFKQHKVVEFDYLHNDITLITKVIFLI